MQKKTQDATYTSTTQTATIGSQGTLLDTKAVITGLVTAMVVGGIIGTFGYSRLTDSNTFRITTTADALEDLKQTSVTREVYQANQEVIEYKLDILNADIQEIKELLKK